MGNKIARYLYMVELVYNLRSSQSFATSTCNLAKFRHILHEVWRGAQVGRRDRGHKQVTVKLDIRFAVAMHNTLLPAPCRFPTSSPPTTSCAASGTVWDLLHARDPVGQPHLRQTRPGASRWAERYLELLPYFCCRISNANWRF
eukprot:COSAG02_NODE_21169_length_799_cov_1.218571_1_plen_144_part_00